MNKHCFIHYLLLSLLIIPGISFCQNDEIRMPKWELDLTSFYYPSIGRLAELDNGTYVQAKGGFSGAITLTRNFKFIEGKNIGVAPVVGFELYPTANYEALYKPPTLPEIAVGTEESSFNSSNFRLGIRLGANFFSQISDSNWEVDFGGGILLFPENDITAKVFDQAFDVTLFRQVTHYENNYLIIGRLNIGIKRYFTLSKKRWGVSLSYLRNFKNKHPNSTLYLNTGNGDFKEFDYNSRLDYLQLSVSIPLSSFKS